MRRGLFDLIADTVLFQVLLALSGLMVLPVLALGVLISPWLILFRPSEPTSVAILALAAGGAFGIVGWLRAHWGVREPERHNITATLVFITIGIATAIAVAAFAAGTGSRLSWHAWSDNLLPAAFAAANGAWVVSGLAWMERLTHGYAERTGQAFDVVPVMLLLIALGLVLAASFVSVSVL
jgi:hypothetical protein